MWIRFPYSPQRTSEKLKSAELCLSLLLAEALASQKRELYGGHYSHLLAPCPPPPPLPLVILAGPWDDGLQKKEDISQIARSHKGSATQSPKT